MYGNRRLWPFMLGKAGSNELIDFLHRVSVISASVAAILIKRFQPLGSQLADLFTIPYPANSARRVLIASDNFTLLENDEHGLIGNAVSYTHLTLPTKA